MPGSDHKKQASSGKQPSAKSLKTHWDSTYDRAAIEQLGWYQEHPEPSLRLIARCKLDQDARILIAGAGATTLVDELLEKGYRNIIATDISSVALNKLQARLGNKSERISWLVDDLIYPTKLNTLDRIDLWHDRAVLHFFTEVEDQDLYFELLHLLLKPGGYALIAAFNLSGTKKCSGLPIHRYDKNMLQEKLGPDYELIEAHDHRYIMPSGDSREYVYTLFRRRN